MAKNPETVSSFLETLSPKLQTLWQKEREVILRYKEEDTKTTGREFGLLLVCAHCPPDALPCPSKPQYHMAKHKRACPSKHFYM